MQDTLLKALHLNVEKKLLLETKNTLDQILLSFEDVGNQDMFLRKGLMYYMTCTLLIMLIFRFS